MLSWICLSDKLLADRVVFLGSRFQSLLSWICLSERGSGNLNNLAKIFASRSHEGWR